MGADVQTVTRSHLVARLSWVDRVKAFIERLPLPVPVVYLLTAALAVGLFALADGLMLGRPADAFEPFHLVLALGPAYTLGLMHLLDYRAGRALARMRPLLKAPETYPEFHRLLTTLPARATLLASLAGMLVGVIAVLVERLALPAVFRPFILAANARLFVEVWLVFGWFVFGALFIHTVHQLRQINRIYTHHTTIDLDQYQMLFHFSNLSALTAIGLLVIPYAWALAIPNLFRDPSGWTFGAFFPIFALTAFLWPLIGVHSLMVEAKGRALLENAAALKDVRRRLFEQVTLGAANEATNFQDTLAAIRQEREALLRVPTWPWQPGTPRSVAAALALPLIVWFLQWVLQQVLGA